MLARGRTGVYTESGIRRARSAWAWTFSVHALLPVLSFPLAAWLLYRRGLELAFFLDDPSHFRWLDSHSFAQLLSQGYYYHRPVVLVLWKAMLYLLGYQRVWFHAFNLLVHLLNAFLVWGFVRLISRRNLLAYLTAFLFLVHPFAYQAVTYVGALFHPLATLFVLVALVSYEISQRHARPLLFWASHLFLFLAYFSHEGAFVAPVLLAALDGLQKRSKRTSLRFFVVAAVALLLWLLVPKTTVSLPDDRGFPLQPLSSIGRNATYALRAAFYPLIPLQPLMGAALVGERAVFPISVLIGLMIVLTAARRSVFERLFGLAAVWIVVCALPAVLFVEPPFVREGHRLFYLMSVGTTLLWGLVLTTPVYAMQERGRAILAVSGVVVAIPVLLLVGQSSWFIQDRIADYERASLLVRRVAQTAAEAPPDRELVYVNLPQFIAPQGNHLLTSPKLYGFREVWTIPGPFTALEDLIRVNGGPPRRARGVFVKALKPYWLPYGTEITLDELRALLRRDVVLLFDPERWDFVNLSAHWFPSAKESPPAEARLSDAVLFGRRIALEGAQVEWGTTTIRVVLWWRSLESTDQSYTVFTHLYDAEGRLVAQHDGIPVEGAVPTSLWRVGDLVRDVHVIAFPDDFRPGRYTLAVGMYNRATMERLPAISQAGRTFEAHRVPLAEWHYSRGDGKPRQQPSPGR